MKKRVPWLFLLIAAGFSLHLISAALAQPGGEPKAGDDQNAPPFPPPRMKEHLKLTDKQVTALKALENEEHQKAVAALHKKERDARDALKAALEKDASEKDLHKLFKDVQTAEQAVSEDRFSHLLEVRKILTAEQRKNFHDMMHERWGRHEREGRHGRPGGPPPPEAPPPPEDH